MSSDEHDCWQVVKALEAENAALKEQVAMLSGAIQALKDYEETPVPHFEWDKHYAALYSALAATGPKGEQDE